MCMRRASQITRLPAPGWSPRDRVSRTRHSILTLLSFTMGGLTRVAGSSVKPAFVIRILPWVVAARQAHLLHHRKVDDIDDYFGHFEDVVPGMFGRIVPDAPGGEKMSMGGVVENRLKKAERAQVHLAGAGRSCWRNRWGAAPRCLQITLSFGRADRAQIDDHFFFSSSSEKSLSSRTIVLVRMPRPSTSISMLSPSCNHCSA